MAMALLSRCSCLWPFSNSWLLTWLNDSSARVAMGSSAEATKSTKIRRATLLRRNVESIFMSAWAQ